MSDIVPIITLALIEEESRQSLRNRIVRPQRLKSFLLPDNEFVSLFRLNKHLVAELIECLRPELEPRTSRRNVLSVETKVLCALRFFATGSYQKCIGNDINVSVSQQTVSNCIIKVSEAVNNTLFERWIQFPLDKKDHDMLKREFMAYSGFPGVIGAIDCTHVAIIAPSDNSIQMEKNYLNRKNFHSLNVQIVCDMKQIITNISARFPGSVHDSYIWRASNLHDAFEYGCLANCNGWLLGDSGYPLQSNLITQYPEAVEGSAEDSFNKAHSRGRCVIERTNGTLKSRFRCLLRHRTLHYTPPVAATIVNTCAILHNMCVKSNVIITNIEVDDEDIPFDTGAPEPSHRQSDRGARDRILRNYFQ